MSNLKYPHIRHLLRDIQSVLNIEADGLIGGDTNAALGALLKTYHDNIHTPKMLNALLLEHFIQMVTKFKPEAEPKPPTKLTAITAHPAKIAPHYQTETPWLDWALGHLGEKEDAGKDNNPFIVGLWKSIGINWTHTTDIDSEVPWCAAFVGAALAHTGYQHTGSGLARSYLSCGVPIKTFQRGCILIWPRGKNPRAGHVDLGVDLMDNGIVTTVGGNVSDQVALRDKQIKDAIGMRMPVALKEAA